jgi:bifunctional non-homologous end joining protein LigD
MVKRTSTRFIARMIEGAKPSDMPGFIAPQLATLRTRPPSGDQWLHEIKYDGYRAQLHVNKQRRIVFTRNGLDWAKRFFLIAGAFDIAIERAMLDGEIVVIKNGRTSFSELQAELAAGNQDRRLFYAFDLLFLEGFDLRNAPLIERKRVLKMLFAETDLESPILYSEHLQIDGNKMLAHACKLKFEGIISKNGDAPHRSERSDAWIKVKCLQRDKFPVVGFVKDPTGVAALHHGRQEGKDLVYSGTEKHRHGKEGELVAVPILAPLADSLAATKTGDLTFLVNERGQPWSRRASATGSGMYAARLVAPALRMACARRVPPARPNGARVSAS